MSLLAEILEARERRVLRIECCLASCPKSFVVSLKLNIPGSKKNSPLFQSVFLIADNELKKKLTEAAVEIITAEQSSSAAGYEGIYVLAPQSLSAVDIKLLLIELEDNDPLGRLFDLDLWHTVEVLEHPDKKYASRQIMRRDLGIAERKCLVCDNDAIVCARGRRHDPEELMDRIYSLVNSDSRITISNIGGDDGNI